MGSGSSRFPEFREVCKSMGHAIKKLGEGVVGKPKRQARKASQRLRMRGL